jgi:serine/threonine-protein kinase
MSDVFVSYKAEDRRRVQPLVHALEADGHSVWWDEQIGGGDAWREMIETELDAARSVIVVWSKHSIGPEGRFVRDEASRAMERGVYLPVRMDDVRLPLGFGETQALPLTGWRGSRSDARYKAVLAAVKRLAGTGSTNDGPHAAQQPAVSRRAVLAGAAVATVAVVGAGAWALLKSTSAEAADSIAVLPFANLSGDPGQAYFSDGIAEELRNALARLAGLKVVGRTSSEAVRNEDAETAAKKLGVATILTGSVRQSPSLIRVSAQLVDGGNGIEKWSNSYDRPPGDAIKIQTDIAENVARALSTALGGAARVAMAVGGTENAGAQRLLFQAEAAARRGDKQALEDGISLADAAIKLDPEYAEAYAQKALFTNWYASTYANDVPQLFKMRTDAVEIANAALRLAPDLATGHRALAEIDRVSLKLRAALPEYRKAIELAPADAGALVDYAFFSAAIGRSDEAIQLSDKAIRLDPLNIYPYNGRFMILMASGRYAEAVSFSQDLERTKPHLFNWPELVAYGLIAQGKLKEAQPYQQKAPADSYNRIVNEAAILSRTGQRDRVQTLVAKMHQIYGDAASYQYGQIYAQMGDKDRAFAALDRAWEIRDSGLLRLKGDPYMDPLRGDPRFAALMKKLDYPA